MKKVIVGLAVVIVAWLGATWYAGSQVEDEIDRHLAGINQNLQVFDIQLEKTNLQQGLFHSDFDLNIKWHNQTRMVLKESIYHGPLPFNLLKKFHFVPQLASIESRLENGELTASLFKATKNEQPVELTVNLDYSNNITFTLLLKAGENLTLPLDESQLSLVKWSDIVIDGSHNGKTLKIAMANDFFDSFVATKVNGEYIKRQITYTDAKIENTFNFIAEKALIIPEIKSHFTFSKYNDNVSQSKQTMTSLFTEDHKDLEGKATLKYSDGYFDFEAEQSGLTSLFFNELDFNLGNLQYEMKIEHINAEAFSQIMQIFLDVVRRGNDPTNIDSYVNYEDELNQAMLTIINEQPKMSFDPISSTLTGGEKAKFTFKMGLAPNVTEIATTPGSQDDLTKIFSELKLAVEFSSNYLQELFKKQANMRDDIEHTLDNAVANGILERKDDKYQLLVKIDDNEVKLNQQAMPKEIWLLGLYSIFAH